MQSFPIQGKLDFLSEDQKVKLSKHFCEPDRTAMPHQLAVLLGVEYSTGLAIIATLEAYGLCENKLLIYHTCEPEVPAGAIKYGIGFPALPWICPLCEEVVENYSDLLFDVMAFSKGCLDFSH